MLLWNFPLIEWHYFIVWHWLRKWFEVLAGIYLGINSDLREALKLLQLSAHFSFRSVYLSLPCSLRNVIAKPNERNKTYVVHYIMPTFSIFSESVYSMRDLYRSLIKITFCFANYPNNIHWYVANISKYIKYNQSRKG